MQVIPHDGRGLSARYSIPDEPNPAGTVRPNGPERGRRGRGKTNPGAIRRLRDRTPALAHRDDPDPTTVRHARPGEKEPNRRAARVAPSRSRRDNIAPGGWRLSAFRAGSLDFPPQAGRAIT